MSDENTTSPPPPEPGPIAKAIDKVATAEHRQQAPRLWLWWLAGVVAFALVWLIAPQQIGNVVNKWAMACLCAVGTYFLDRAFYMFLPVHLDESLPDSLLGAARLLARPIIFLGFCLVIGLGV